MQKIDLRLLQNRSIDELLVHSLDQSLYLVRVVIDGQYYDVERKSKSYRSFSVGEIHKDFSNCNIKKFTLLQNSAYDEMVGQPVKEVPNTLMTQHLKTDQA